MNLRQFLWEGIKFATHAVNSKKTRSFLTMLGVATGIFAITGILTMVNSLEKSVSQSLAALGNTTLFVHHWPWKDNSEDWFKYFNRPKVSYHDYEQLKKNLKGVSGINFEASVSGVTARARGNEITNLTLSGTTLDMLIIGEPNFIEGRFFSEMEDHLGSAVCVVGYNIANNLFPNEAAAGKLIRVGKKRLRIVGVLEKKGAAMFGGGGSEDDRIYVPYQLMARVYNLNRRSVEKIIAIKAETHELVPFVEDEVIGIIRAARGLKPKVEDNFSINKQEALMTQLESVFGIIDTGGMVISIFSLLIGGFSIGMIMYISVRERTGEIGVQKALGSTRGFILYQFMVEALLLCLSGGLVGILGVFGFGALADVMLNSMEMGLSVFYSMEDLAMGLGLSALIGLVAGIVPAWIAARLDPVIAIRFS